MQNNIDIKTSVKYCIVINSSYFNILGKEQEKIITQNIQSSARKDRKTKSKYLNSEFYTKANSSNEKNKR